MDETVTVVYALADVQCLRRVPFETGMTVALAIERSGILEEFPAIDLKVNRVGVFGHPCSLHRVLEPGERVEIYRSLASDPRIARRRRVRSISRTGRAGDRR